MAFISGHDDPEHEKLRNLFQELYCESKGNGSELVIAAALSAWALLATSMKKSRLGRNEFLARLPQLMKLLDHDALEVRAAAGENIALMYAAQLPSADATPSAGPQVAPALSLPTLDSTTAPPADEEKSIPGMDDLVGRLEALSTDGSKHVARKTRKEQRSIFRDILATVESGELPSETMTVSGNKHDFNGWSDLHRLDTVRAILTTGLPHHFANNELLSFIFNLPFRPVMEEAPEARAFSQVRYAQCRQTQGKGPL